MTVALYQAKAEFFRMLGHPVRIRVLELLQAGPTPVRCLLTELEIEPSSLSQQLAVLRRSGIVTATRDGSTVVYALAGGDVADLLRAARRILTGLLADRNLLLAELRADPDQEPEAGPEPEHSQEPEPVQEPIQAPGPDRPAPGPEQDRPAPGAEPADPRTGPASP